MALARAMSYAGRQKGGGMQCHECGKKFQYGLCPRCFVALLEIYRREVLNGINQHRQHSGAFGGSNVARHSDGSGSGHLGTQKN